jgi:hypothetical protein
MRHLNTHIRKLIWDLKKEDIAFSFDMETTNSRGTTQRLCNVVFTRGDIVYKIYEGVFFREFGQCVYFKKVKNEIVLSQLTDDIFYEWQRTGILAKFN